MTQIEELQPKNVITVSGIEYHLRRSSRDSTTEFSHNRVVWVNTGCFKYREGIHACWIMGIIQPAPNTIETPVSCVYVGFSPVHINMSSQVLTINDLNNMNIYVSDCGNLMGDFINEYLGIPTAVNRESTMMPFPPAIEEVPDVKSNLPSR